MVISWLNGQAVDSISLNDRAYLYGDGFFTTAAVSQGQVLLRQYHLERLHRSAVQLHIALDMEALETSLNKFLSVNLDMLPGHCHVLKIIISRQQDARSYRPQEDAGVNTLMQLFAFGDHELEALQKKRERGLRVQVASPGLGINPALAGIKHLSRLENVLVAASVDFERFDEGLVFTCDGTIVEGVMSNLVLFPDAGRKIVITPKLDQAGVEGVMKRYILSRLQELGYDIRHERVELDDLLQCDALFMTNSLLGFCRIEEIDAYPWRKHGTFGAQLESLLDIESVTLQRK